MLKTRRFTFAWVAGIAVLGGCTAALKNTTTLQNAASDFNKTVQAASQALTTERTNKPRTRRAEAIEYYLATRQYVGRTDIAVVPDIISSDINSSFARYACAGSGSLLKEKTGLDYASAYSAGLQDIMAAGDDTLAGQFARFKALKKPITVAAAPAAPASGAVKNCADDLATRIASWKPEPTTDEYDESPLLALQAAITAYQAIESFIETGLKDYNNYQQRKKFIEYVNKWDASFTKTVTDTIPQGALAIAWSHRIVVSVQRPLITFNKIFKTPAGILPDDDKDRIRLLGLDVNDQLSEFDALRASPQPEDIRSALLEAEQKIVKLANDNSITIDQVVSFLSGLQTEFTDAKTKYDAANKAAQALRSQIH